jgi:mono/diheme cytochrome c family protein
MRFRVMVAAAAAVLALTIAQVSMRAGAMTPMQNTWILGADADTKKNPHPVDAKLLAAGKAVYKNKCERCHGPGGLGDGPDAEPESAEDMDLTNPKRAARNTDGVVYYKVLNGRKKPKMPAFKDELSEQQIWQVVAYVQSLRKK